MKLSKDSDVEDQMSSLTSLKKLKLAGNGIWGEGVSAIIEMLKKIVATTNCVEEPGITDIDTKRMSLVELDLSNNSKIQEEQKELLNRWCVAAGVTLKLKNDNSRNDLQVGGGLGVTASRPLPNIVSGERAGVDDESRRKSSPSVRR